MKKAKSSKPISDNLEQPKDLLANSAIYKAIWDNSINALFIATPEGQTLAANQAACNMFGYSEEELIKIGREGIILHNDAFLKLNEARHEQGNATGEFNCIRKSGEHFTCKISSAVIIENNRKIIITTMMEDISEQRKAEKLLDNTNRIAKVGGWELDIFSNKIYWTPVARLIHEVDEHFDVTSVSMNQFYKNHDDNIKIKTALAQGESLDMETQIITAKGNERWIRLTAKPDFEFNKLVRYYGSIQDISDIKRVESVLEKSRQEYKAIFENSTESILSVNLDGIIQMANPGASELYECPVDQLIGKHFGDFTLPQFKVPFEKNLAEVMNGKTSRSAVREIISAKGNKKIILGNLAPIKINGQIVGVSAIANDITARQHYQKELEFHSRLLNTIHQAVKVVDLDDKVIYWNDYSTKLYGWTREETLGKNIHEFNHRLMSKELDETIKEKLLHGESWSGELTMRHKNNNTFKAFVFDSPFKDEAGNVIGILTISFDNTKEVEARHYSELQAKLLNTIQQAVMVISLEGTITYWSEFATALFGWDREEVLGKAMIPLMIPSSFHEQAANVAAMMSTGEKWAGEFPVLTKAGKEIIVYAVDSPMLDEKGELKGTIITCFDNTKGIETRNQIEFQAKLLNTIQQSVVVTDAEANVTYMNDHAIKIYGWQREEAYGKNVIEIGVAEPSVEEALAIVEKLKHGETWMGELTVKTKDNKEFISQVIDSPIKDENGNFNGSIFISFDKTEEVEKRKEIQFQAKLLNTINEAVMVFDLENKVTYWNDFATHLYGWTSEEVIGKNVLEFLAPEISQEEIKAMKQTSWDKKGWSGELPFRTKENKKIVTHLSHSPLLAESGNITGMISVSYDITKEVEARNYIQFQARLLDIVEQAVFSVDITGKINYWNRHAEKLFGWTKEEAVGNQSQIIIVGHPSMTEKRNSIKNVLMNGESWSGEFIHQRKNKEFFPSFATLTPIFDDHQQPTGVISATYDITALKEQEKQKEIERLDKEALINTTDDSIWSMDKNYNMLAGNKPFLDYIKKVANRDFKKGDPILYPGLVDDDYIKFLYGIYNRGLSGETISLEFESPKSQKWFEHSVHPIFDQEEVIGIACRSKDITHRKELEKHQELEQLDKEALINTTEDYIWSMDKDHKLLAANHAFDEVIKFLTNRKFNRGDIISLKGVFPDRYSQFFEDSFQRALSGESFSVEFSSPITNKWFELTVHPIINHDEIIGVACYHKNITERKLAEEEIRISQERYEFLAKATNDCIWDWNIQLNETQWSGSGMETLFGHRLTNGLTSLNDFWNLHLHPDDAQRVSESLLEIFSIPDHNVWECEYRFLKADGMYAHVYDKGYVIRDEVGKPIRMIGAMQDITHRKETEVQLKNLNEKLAQRARDLQESNSELERFAYVASHDLQEPLRMVTSFLQLLEERFKDNPDPKVHKFIGFAVDGSKRMKQLINDLLEYSRVGTTKDILGETDMNEVVSSVLNVFKLKIEETNASIVVGHLPVLPNTRRTQMNQLMQNLIGNALKYNISAKPEIIIDAQEDEQSWTFSVKDNGIGFETKFNQKIFDIFQRLHSQSEYSGTGIGLSICKKIVERHGGKIWVDSTEGVGSTFYFSFPKNATE